MKFAAVEAVLGKKGIGVVGQDTSRSGRSCCAGRVSAYRLAAEPKSTPKALKCKGEESVTSDHVSRQSLKRNDKAPARYLSGLFHSLGKSR